MKKIFIGSGMIVAAAAGIWYVCHHVSYFQSHNHKRGGAVGPPLICVLFGVAYWGFRLLVKGAIIVAAPQTQSGDVAEL
jgi:hypothetical protein